MANTLQSGATTYHFGTGDANIVSISVEKSFGTNIEAIDGTGQLTDILVGAEQHKFTMTQYAGTGATAALGGSVNAGGVSGTVQKLSTVNSNEDFSKLTIEGIYYPTL